MCNGQPFESSNLSVTATFKPESIEKYLRFFSFRARPFNPHCDTEVPSKFWQEGVHPEWIHNEAMMRQKIDYIHYNPLKRGYVDQAKHWRCSSARNYTGEQGLLEVSRQS